MAKNENATWMMVISDGWPGYWGKASAIPQAISNAQYLRRGDRVRIYRCTPDAYMDGMGNAYGILDDDPILRGTVSQVRKGGS